MSADLWIQPNQFSLAVPENWHASEPNGLTELVPALDDAAINITVLKKMRDSGSGSEDAQTVVKQFAIRNELTSRGELNLNSHGCWWMCFGEYKATDATKIPKYWAVCGAAGQSRAVIASLCCDSFKSSSYSEGVQILHSLQYLE